ncbi:hypothetical protein IU500_34425 [Nocardia terpenica]|uniref:hypothetical protein n=1 Tax=Nocardia terpenica TaxID=455432 RepID=UPI001895E835|nr:hypothetical protein [Nocardia terpenica]MBF6065431.1 hypothetical protein [Nocardia terpenica]MBF6109113.1 hypothetical protein [Nocardia terpenica]MBF6114685.1 hypothetical protein [Nocardia terpenica]MBF6123370.1 hypothetical protein [Nocardia terpenica]MBF6156612.1 hypothetical protein [Nocardia terpenica]
MNRHQENRMRADFGRFYETGREATRLAELDNGGWVRAHNTAAAINAQYADLPVGDGRGEAWWHLTDIAEQWDRTPDEMFELTDELERDQAAGKPVVPAERLRDYQQVRHLYITRVHRRHVPTPPPVPSRQPITRSR